MPDVLNVSAFGGGIVLEGSSDAQRTDELRACDSYDIGPRGQLVAASDVSSYADAKTSAIGSPNPLSPVYGIEIITAPQLPRIVAVGDFSTFTYISFLGLDGTSLGGSSKGAAHGAGYSVTFASFPYVDKSGKQLRIVLVAIAARPAYDPRIGLGLFVVVYDSSGPTYLSNPISQYDSLGTGPGGEFPTGTKSKMLYPRGVMAYNGHALLWGFDNSDASSGDGPNRVMISNTGNPLKYGYDPLAAAIAAGTTSESDRDFVDSDAVVIGGAGCVIRAGLVWGSRAWFGTSDGLHYLEGSSRESFLANGPVPVRQSKNVIGPNALVEGPDGLLHGVGDHGHWVFDGANSIEVGNKLRDFDAKSIGYWDLIWTDTTRVLGTLPGQSNQDFVWMLADREAGQVLIGIPYCNATTGYGYGTDTVILKYHVGTGGYTRQVFAGKIILDAVTFRREQTAAAQRFFAGASLPTNVVRHRFQATAASSPALPSALPDVTFGEYAPFGPNGIGTFAKRYLTLSWASAVSTLGLVFLLTPTVDGETLAPVKLSVQAAAPSSPSDGDYWIDTSGTDTNIGNSTAGAITPAHPGDFIPRTYKASWAKWVPLAGGGQQGRRITIPVTFVAARGSRLLVRCQCIAMDRRVQIEGFAEEPDIIRAGA